MENSPNNAYDMWHITHGSPEQRTNINNYDTNQVIRNKISQSAMTIPSYPVTHSNPQMSPQFMNPWSALPSSTMPPNIPSQEQQSQYNMPMYSTNLQTQTSISFATNTQQHNIPTSSQYYEGYNSYCNKYGNIEPNASSCSILAPKPWPETYNLPSQGEPGNRLSVNEPAHKEEDYDYDIFKKCEKCQRFSCQCPSKAKYCNDDKRMYVCHIEGCDKKFNMSDLKKHLKCHTDDQPFVCKWDRCQKSFIRKYELLRHELIHIDERNYLCDMCDKRFMRSDHLNRHKKTHENQRPGYPRWWQI